MHFDKTVYRQNKSLVYKIWLKMTFRIRRIILGVVLVRVGGEWVFFSQRWNDAVGFNDSIFEQQWVKLHRVEAIVDIYMRETTNMQGDWFCTRWKCLPVFRGPLKFIFWRSSAFKFIQKYHREAQYLKRFF